MPKPAPFRTWWRKGLERTCLNTSCPPPFSETFEFLRALLQRTLALSERLSDTASAALIRDRFAHLESAALFVVVGEVKSGKSRFVNALLGEEVCEVAPDPCTAGIQELVYGEAFRRHYPGGTLGAARAARPALKDITMVDTPGTNSIVRHHETLTENYIPRSDLVIFVFPAKNPHTGSAWELLDLIRREWRRKTLFVLQQADLASQQELMTNLERGRQYARERNIQNPVVFALSAKREQEGASDSGFAEFRAYLRQAVESGDVWQMKVEGARDTAFGIAGKALTQLRREEAAIVDDRSFYTDLITRIESRREKARSLKRLLVDSLDGTYQRLSSALEAEIETGLRVENILRRSIPWIRDSDFQAWMEEIQSRFEKKAREEIEADALRASKDIADEMQTMVDELVQAVNLRRKASDLMTVPVAWTVRTSLIECGPARGVAHRRIVGDSAVQASDLGSLTLTGGGMAALGAVIGLATHFVVVDITGGVLAALGVAL
jgi:ribosome biogenesis GTPase A